MTFISQQQLEHPGHNDTLDKLPLILTPSQHVDSKLHWCHDVWIHPTRTRKGHCDLAAKLSFPHVAQVDSYEAVSGRH